MAEVTKSMKNEAMSKMHQAKIYKISAPKRGNGNSLLQIHKKSSNPLPPILGIELIKEIIKVRFVFLPYFIVQNLKSLSVLCTL
jgi:hypothetical protein